MLKGKKLALYLLIILALAFNARAVYSPDQYTVALWHFDECSGDTAADSSGNGNTGALNNVEWTTDSVSGCAVKFNGIDSLINIFRTPSVDIPSQVTLEAWVKRNSNTAGTIISKNGPYYIAINQDGTIRAGVYTDTWHEFGSITNLQVGQWYHIAMAYDESKLKTYINGIVDSSIPVTGAILQTGQSAHIGWGEPGQNQFFDGIIDEARISNISRTNFDVAITTILNSTCNTNDLFCDDFNDNSAGGWNPNAGTWTVEQGNYIQSTGELRVYNHNNFLPPTDDYRIEADVRFYDVPGPGESAVALLTKFQNQDDFGISLGLNPYFEGGTVILFVGTETNHNFQQYHLSKQLLPLTWYHLRIDILDGLINAYINDELVVSNVPVPQLNQNVPEHIALATHNLPGIFDNVRVTELLPTQTTTVSTTTTSTIVTTIPVYSRDEVDALLAERDARISALESRASLLETALSNVRNTLTTLQNTVSNLFTSLFGLPKGLRQEMICSSMKATNQTFAQGFGLTCSINEKGACSCI